MIAIHRICWRTLEKLRTDVEKIGCVKAAKR